MKIRFQFALCLVLAGCASTQQSASPPSNWKSEPEAAGANATPGTLYARDGTAVPASGTAPTREIGGEGSRVFLLDLYQRAMDEKDTLTLHIQGLEAQLTQETKKAADSAQQAIAQQAAIDALTKERDALRNDTIDLAQRLTTAQVRRLEAEKSLLELQIDVQRREEAAQTVRGAAMIKKSGGDKQ